MKTLTSNPINNSVFDTRDLIEYRNDLENSILEAYNDLNEGNEVSTVRDVENAANEAFMGEWGEDIQEYNDIYTFCYDLSSADDFEYGESVIHKDYFTEYTEELLTDVGYLANDLPSWIVIDMDATAENVKQDYISIEYKNETYYIR